MLDEMKKYWHSMGLTDASCHTPERKRGREVGRKAHLRHALTCSQTEEVSVCKAHSLFVLVDGNYVLLNKHLSLYDHMFLSTQYKEKI